MKKEKPVIQQEEDYMPATMTHPAFGEISVSEVRGNYDLRLAGTDRDTSDYLTLQISQAEYDSWSNQPASMGNQIVNFMMSKDQLQQLVTGKHAPCTISWIRGEGSIPAIDMPTNKEASIQRVEEASEKLNLQIESISKDIEEILSVESVPPTQANKIKAAFSKLKSAAAKELPELTRQAIRDIEASLSHKSQDA